MARLSPEQPAEKRKFKYLTDDSEQFGHALLVVANWRPETFEVAWRRFCSLPSPVPQTVLCPGAAAGQGAPYPVQGPGAADGHGPQAVRAGRELDRARWPTIAKWARCRSRKRASASSASRRPSSPAVPYRRPRSRQGGRSSSPGRPSTSRTLSAPTRTRGGRSAAGSSRWAGRSTASSWLTCYGGPRPASSCYDSSRLTGRSPAPKPRTRRGRRRLAGLHRHLLPRAARRRRVPHRRSADVTFLPLWGGR